MDAFRRRPWLLRREDGVGDWLEPSPQRLWLPAVLRLVNTRDTARVSFGSVVCLMQQDQNKGVFMIWLRQLEGGLFRSSVFYTFYLHFLYVIPYKSLTKFHKCLQPVEQRFIVKSLVLAVGNRVNNHEHQHGDEFYVPPYTSPHLICRKAMIHADIFPSARHICSVFCFVFCKCLAFIVAHEIGLSVEDSPPSTVFFMKQTSGPKHRCTTPQR